MIGGMAAVVAASALLAVGLAGGPLYVSSASSEALQIAMAGTCATDVGLDLVVPAFGSSSSDDAPALSAWLDERSVEVPNAKAPVLSRATWPNYTLRGGDGLARRMVLLWRDGQLEHLDIDATLGGTIGNGRILAADQARDRAAIATGSVLDISIASALRPMPVAKTLEVAGTYRDIPFLPEPSYWCGWRASVRPSPSGDPPPLLMIADESVFDALPGEVVYTTWELRPRSNRLTVAEAESLSAGYHRVRAEFDQHLADAIAEMSEADQAFWAASLPRQAEPRIDLLIAQSRQVGTVVGRTMAPVRLAGVAADVMLLFGAAVLVARQRERELRLRLLRGDSAVMIAGRVAIGQAIPVALGTAVGAAMALLAIVTVGPTPELDRDRSSRRVCRRSAGPWPRSRSSAAWQRPLPAGLSTARFAPDGVGYRLPRCSRGWSSGLRCSRTSDSIASVVCAWSVPKQPAVTCSPSRSRCLRWLRR